ncbi:hypothetical protein [Baaleninema simplex]|uniref:hypothetical protein n=1 Tax=Baaleninema simplex TaxID=2862350 RepID=UPI0003467A6D|nr:hypothetical protein [Baaleninema simplex]
MQENLKKSQAYLTLWRYRVREGYRGRSQRFSLREYRSFRLSQPPRETVTDGCITGNLSRSHLRKANAGILCHSHESVVSNGDRGKFSGVSLTNCSINDIRCHL